MNTFLYRIAISGYHLAIRVAAVVGVEQARRWVAGRANPAAFQLPSHLRPRPNNPLSSERQLVWMHCASLGEFEQGRPVLEALREARPDWKILLTFFSPSGYERCKDEPLADHVAYLPADGPARAQAWVNHIRPGLAIFVKYEFWFFHLRALHRAGVPTFLVAASFRPNQWFFQRSGSWWRRMLTFFDNIIVQTPGDKALLTGPGKYPTDQVVVAGDPRMDRTLQLAGVPFTDDIIAAFTAGDPITIIAGSVWPQDVERWLGAWPQLPANCRLILAPHQLHEKEIAGWREAFDAVRYTEAEASTVGEHRVLILDTIGILSRAYRYGRLAYVGGAFKTGLHNTLEPLAYSLPVLFGPLHHKFPEAGEAIRRGGAFSVPSDEELRVTVTTLLDEESWRKASLAQRDFALANAGAGQRTAALILDRLEKNG
jgi:3-deoxy-D-manno-octulosonic-acid transferase